MDNGFRLFGNWNKIPLHKADYSTTDVSLRLDLSGGSRLQSSISVGRKRKWGDITEVDNSGDGFLTLGLVHSSSTSDNSKGTSATDCTMSSVKDVTDEESSVDLGLNFQLHLGNDSTFNVPRVQRKVSKTSPIYDLQLSLSTGPSDSVITSVAPFFSQQPISTVLTIDEVSTEACLKSGRKIPTLNNTDTNLHQNAPSKPDTIACTAGVSHSYQHNTITNTKTCRFQGCVKGARGSSGLCIAHGGGRRCQKPGCQKGAEGRTVYCKAHGGGRRCEFLGCTKSAEGRTDYCIAHGGGRRCTKEGCIRAARGKSGLCIRHGGGKRCQMENCTKSAEGHSGLCISHGGGRRCQFPQCTKGAQGSTMLCKAHGGGKRCTVIGCTKGAEGSTSFCKGHGGGKRCSFQDGGMCSKSVHGGTQFCVAHGGGKRCAVAECTKSARGRTDYCVRHGGGKRCKSDGCGKSAQGSTDFCKAHGGGKRCLWGHGGSTDPSTGGPPCDRFARGKTGLCAAHTALMQDQCIHGGETLGPVTPNPEKLKGIVVVEGAMFSESMSDESYMPCVEPKQFIHPGAALPSNSAAAAAAATVPEGRVHGGSLLAFLSTHGEAGSTKQGLAYNGMHSWM